MAIDKRHSTTEPLTEHDVAERLNKAVMRVLSIMSDIRQTPDLAELVKNSRYLTNAPELLLAELKAWGYE